MQSWTLKHQLSLSMLTFVGHLQGTLLLWHSALLTLRKGGNRQGEGMGVYQAPASVMCWKPICEQAMPF